MQTVGPPPGDDLTNYSTFAARCCCGCQRCDWDIGTIGVTAAGSYDLVAEYESTSFPTFWDHETFSFTWSISGSYTQIDRDTGSNPAKGEFVWHDNRTENQTYGTCDCEWPGTGGRLFRGAKTFGNISGGTYHLADTVLSVRHLVVDRDTPTFIITDNNYDVTVSLYFRQNLAADEEGFYYDDGTEKWTCELGMTWSGAPVGLGPPFPDTIPGFGVTMGFMVCTASAEKQPCEHPFGTFTGTGADSSSLAGDPWYTITSNVTSCTVTVNGTGGVTNCAAAPIAGVANRQSALGREDEGIILRQDGAIALRQ